MSIYEVVKRKTQKTQKERIEDFKASRQEVFHNGTRLAESPKEKTDELSEALQRIKELEKESDIWDKHSLVELVTRSKAQDEQIKALEEENARLGKAFETEVWDKTTYLDLSEVQQKRIKELEAGLMSVAEPKDEFMGEAAAANHRWIEALMETFALKNAHKWAKRWKRATIARENKICELNLTQAVFSIALLKRDERIAALENAARSCATCLRFDEVFEHEDCKRCEAVFEESGELFSAWTFDEARYAPKGNTERKHRK